MTTQNRSKKTLTEQLVEAEARVETIKQRIAAEALINNVDVGDDVEFAYGRAERKRLLRGTVEGKKETDQGLQLRVTVGEGFDAEGYKPFARDLTQNFTKGTTAPANDDADNSEAVDPLAAAE